MTSSQATGENASPQLENTSGARLLSLDVFRGITIAAMLLVNNPGDWEHVYQPLEHAKWHGCTPTDLIFPFFLFIMGVAMTFSFARRISEKANRAALAGPILRRTILLIVLGLILNWMSYMALHSPEDPNLLRFPGVLQRIGLCYLLVSLLMLTRATPLVLASTGVLLLAVYTGLMKYVPVPGFGRGVLEFPGNLASYIDQSILGRHCYDFNAKTGHWHDPEGLLSTLPAVVTTISGVLTGFWLRDKLRSSLEKICGMFTVGCALVAAGLLWNYSFPLNKNIWSPSYVLFTSGWALNCLAICYWIIDIKGIRGWTLPFRVYGTNAIAAYFGVGVMAYGSVWIKWIGPDGKPLRLKTWMYNHLIKSWAAPAFGDYVSSALYPIIIYVTLWCILIYVLLYRRKIFIKV